MTSVHEAPKEAIVAAAFALVGHVRSAMYHGAVAYALRDRAVAGVAGLLRKVSFESERAPHPEINLPRFLPLSLPSSKVHRFGISEFATFAMSANV
jgi:hypothetical protein